MWNTTEWDDGEYTISARAGSEGEWSALSLVNVTVDNPEGGGGDSGSVGEDDDDDDSLIPAPPVFSFLVAVAVAVVFRRNR